MSTLLLATKSVLFHRRYPEGVAPSELVMQGFGFVFISLGLSLFWVTSSERTLLSSIGGFGLLCGGTLFFATSTRVGGWERHEQWKKLFFATNTHVEYFDICDTVSHLVSLVPEKEIMFEDIAKIIAEVSLWTNPYDQALHRSRFGHRAKFTYLAIITYRFYTTGVTGLSFKLLFPEKTK